VTRLEPPAHPLSDEELEDALRRFFDADRLPEIATVPLALLAELARRVHEAKEVER
jgi:hypothetical protein